LHDLRADLIVVVRFLDRALFEDLEKTLLPDGILAYETFLKGQPGPRPQDPRHLLERGELLRAFPHLQILESATDTSTATHVERLIACRTET
jgi:hypothetical protein